MVQNLNVFSLREKLEKPLCDVDKIIVNFTKNLGKKAGVISNYRDGVNRIIFWREGRMVKYIQVALKQDETQAYQNIIYEVFASAFKIRLPLLHFWNAYFNGSGGYFKTVGVVESPIDTPKLIDLLNAAYESLKLISRSALK